MPARKIPPYKTLVRNLLASKKLRPGEHTAFEKMVAKFTSGQELDTSEKLWIETLNTKYLAKKG